MGYNAKNKRKDKRGAGKGGRPRKNRETKLVLTFDEEDRKEYLTGAPSSTGALHVPSFASLTPHHLPSPQQSCLCAV